MIGESGHRGRREAARDRQAQSKKTDTVGEGIQEMGRYCLNSNRRWVLKHKKKYGEKEPESGGPKVSPKSWDGCNNQNTEFSNVDSKATNEQK